MQAHLVTNGATFPLFASIAFFAGLLAIVVILYKTKESKKINKLPCCLKLGQAIYHCNATNAHCGHCKWIA